MTFEVVIGAEAEADLFEIYRHIARQSGRRRAGDYVDRIEAFCLDLEAFPERGLARDDLQSNLRIIAFRRQATIAYTIDQGRVVILRIFNAGRDYERALKDEDGQP